ncbi:MAG: hypothetical protein WBV55_09040 [Candidatus Sulfotelmatobacter sp.]
MNFNKSDQSWRSALWKPALLFVIVSALLIAADQLSLHFGLEGARRIVDDLLGGLIAGSIFHLYERQKARRLSEQLHLIDLTNHHIRNALQPLMFVAQGSEGKAQMKVVEECVRRIDWALREVLPGNSQEQFVAHPRASTRRNGLTLRIQQPAWSSESEHSRPEPSKTQPKPFFSHWLDTWRHRNEKAS